MVTCTYVDGELQALGFADGGLRVIESATGRVLLEGRCAQHPVGAVALTERWLVAGCGDQVEVWGRATGARHEGAVPEVRTDPPPKELAQAVALYKARQYTDAATLFEASPHLAEAAYWLGLTRQDTRAFEPAVDAFRQCLQLDPRHHRAATEIGETWRKAGRYEEAIAAYGEALELVPDYLYALSGRAECLRMLGRHAEALVQFVHAVDEGPRHAFAVQGLAATYNKLERYAQAWAWWKLALVLQPRSSFAREGLEHCERQGFTGL
jgi:tetratricopeptide (TPR) repeat protein